MDTASLDPATILDWLEGALAATLAYLTSLSLYIQLGTLVLAILLTWPLARFLFGKLENVPPDGTGLKARLLQRLPSYKGGLFPLLVLLALAVGKSELTRQSMDTWLLQIVQGLTGIYLLYYVIIARIQSPYFRNLCTWIFLPLIVLYTFGVLEELIAALDQARFTIGNIDFSLYTLARIVIFGMVLFWLGRVSNSTGKNFIRKRMVHDETTRELSLKAFQIAIVVVFGLLFLQVAGIDVTALVVFSGAIGVGLGFGLQQIASNFISGIIILLDRSIKIGDYIEMEDGKMGVLRELGMRSATIETFDGRDIMIPNEKFITTSFVNWTHQHGQQRYEIRFAVAYETDIEKLFPLVRETVAAHPQVMGPAQTTDVIYHPDAEIEEFADSGINILVEFWMEGIDDGRNKVAAELKFALWKALKDHGFKMPFPQREVRILGEKQ